MKKITNKSNSRLTLPISGVTGNRINIDRLSSVTVDLSKTDIKTLFIYAAMYGQFMDVSDYQKPDVTTVIDVVDDDLDDEPGKIEKRKPGRPPNAKADKSDNTVEDALE